MEEHFCFENYINTMAEDGSWVQVPSSPQEGNLNIWIYLIALSNLMVLLLEKDF